MTMARSCESALKHWRIGLQPTKQKRVAGKTRGPFPSGIWKQLFRNRPKRFHFACLWKPRKAATLSPKLVVSFWFLFNSTPKRVPSRNTRPQVPLTGAPKVARLALYVFMQCAFRAPDRVPPGCRVALHIEQWAGAMERGEEPMKMKILHFEPLPVRNAKGPQNRVAPIRGFDSAWLEVLRLLQLERTP